MDKKKKKKTKKNDAQQPTVQQVVQSAYGWACGELKEGKLIDPADLWDKGADSLEDFLITETGAEEWDGPMEENSPEHWAQAIGRMDQVVREVVMVRAALRKYAPAEAVAQVDADNDNVIDDEEDDEWRCASCKEPFGSGKSAPSDVDPIYCYRCAEEGDEEE